MIIHKQLRNYFIILVFLLSTFSISTMTSAATTYQGIALGTPTNIFEQMDTDSLVLKGYDRGSLLKYTDAALEGWYEATVYIDGEAITGYIPSNEVETIQDPTQSLTGIALTSSTAIYSETSPSSKPLKSYSQGTVLKYKLHTSGWYKATVYLKGVATTGYIRTKDVENSVLSKESISGIGLQSPTNVYSKASTNSSPLKSYAEGTILRVKTFTSNWYEATVYVKGATKTGYVHANHIETLWSSTPQTIEGATLESPTNVYSKASRNSAIVKSYTQGQILTYQTLSDHWYSVTVYLNGEATTGYLHRYDVQGLTTYNVSLADAVQMQVNVNPLTDESGIWERATDVQVSHYLNPDHFLAYPSTFYQFLVLSDSAGTKASEINNTLLKDKGILTGKAEAFIEAAKTHHVNEVYLISHALLETGNGSSILANGVEVSSVDGEEVEPKVVYNMFGIGAKDEDPFRLGTEHAYKAGWTTPEKAIIGGAQFIGDGYINAGQDTLYEMRWNPKGMETYGYATHQYASDIGWAYKQTARISSMYEMLSTYSLKLDVPAYQEF